MLQAVKTKSVHIKNENIFVNPRLRPQVTQGVTHRINTGCGNLYVTINLCEDGRPFELFTKMGKTGGCSSAQCEALGRIVSLALRCNINPEMIIRQLSEISCHQPTWENGKQVKSCADGISKVLKKFLSGENRDGKQI